MKHLARPISDFRKTSFFGIMICLFLGASTAWSEVDKSQYSLLNPVPKENLREFSTDRPDKTESPYTVDAGHFQIETDLITLTQDKSEDAGVETQAKSYGIFVTSLKVGLTNAIDLHVVVTPHQAEEIRMNGNPDEKKSGFGDTVIRLKYNFFGDDGGDIAMGLIPFVKIPTHTGEMGNKKVEGGLILPIALSLPQSWKMGIMAQVNQMKNDADENFHAEFISSITTSHDIAGDLGGYFEFYSQSSQEEGANWIATADFGLTYGLTPDVQLDAGANFGVTRAADDLNPFIGISARF